MGTALQLRIPCALMQLTTTRLAYHKAVVLFVCTFVAAALVHCLHTLYSFLGLLCCDSQAAQQ